MAELATAETPETVAPSDAAPIEETAADEGLSTETVSEDAETQQEVFTQAQLEEQVKAAVEARERELSEARERDTRTHEKTEAQKERSGALMNRVGNLAHWVAKEVDGGKTPDEVMRQLNRAVVENIVGPLEAMVFSEQWDAIGEDFDQYVKKVAPEYKPSQESTRKLEQAMASKRPDKLIEARWELLRDAVISVEVPKALQAAQDAEKAKQKPVNALKAKQAEDAARNAQERPTGLAGGSSPRQQFSTMLQVDTAFAEGKITDQEMYRYLALHKEGRLPYR